MISYKPFRHYMVEHDIDRDYLLNEVGISSTTFTKLNQDKPVRMDILEKICLHFKIPIEQVIEIKENH
ncbi:helix-turn-helix domain-containing protein [Zhenhengia yiwuensis]|uniref:Helix-turn-helix transcriptional regulator n=1 Tax=Zhenhengia yiwuensis TaxID=2763666 RepID=A0A926ELY1_9FIRM|nr:helix-turn-helix transcriptional regulator [Zhenhengia yiwuensis]MBC8580473.1 helix-turn-helix transcriptional regulator [Zhenhengia yiwuensis]